MLKLKLQYFGRLIQKANSLQKTLVLGKIEGRRRRGNRGWDCWMASLTQWTWVWANSGKWWRIGKPGVLQSMGCKESDTIQWLNKNNSIYLIGILWIKLVDAFKAEPATGLYVLFFCFEVGLPFVSLYCLACAHHVSSWTRDQSLSSCFPSSKFHPSLRNSAKKHHPPFFLLGGFTFCPFIPTSLFNSGCHILPSRDYIFIHPQTVMNSSKFQAQNEGWWTRFEKSLGLLYYRRGENCIYIYLF